MLATLGAVSDFSFAWGLMDTYTPALQAQASLSPPCCNFAFLIQADTVPKALMWPVHFSCRLTSASNAFGP